MASTPSQKLSTNKRPRAPHDRLSGDESHGKYPHTKQVKRIESDSRFSKSVTSPAQIQRPAKRLSGLERLPAELLESIFLHSLNVNLPRASPFISKALSTEYVYKQFSSVVLFSYVGVENHQYPFRHPRGSTVKDLTCERTRALSCRWMTLERFEKYYSLFIKEEQVRLNRDVMSRPRKWDDDGWDATNRAHMCLHLGGAIIPSKVLKCPMDESRTTFLQVLVDRGAIIDAETYANTCIGDEVEEVWKDAFLRKDWGLLSLLESPQVKWVLPLKVLRWAFTSGLPDAEFIRLVARSCDSYRPELFPWTDPIVAAALLAKISEGRFRQLLRDSRYTIHQQTNGFVFGHRGRDITKYSKIRRADSGFSR